MLINRRVPAALHSSNHFIASHLNFLLCDTIIKSAAASALGPGFITIVVIISSGRPVCVTCFSLI